MKKIEFSDGPLDPVSFPSSGGTVVTDGLVSQPLLPVRQGALNLWRHQAAVGGHIALSQPAEDHVFYVAAGSVAVTHRGDCSPVEVGGVVCVAKAAVAEINATAGDTVLLHYIGDAASRPDSPGGCVHIQGQEGKLVQDVVVGGADTRRIFYADSGCPTCGVWLHKLMMPPCASVQPHCHSEDEIITVLQGVLMLGTHALKAGGTVAIAKEAYYGFAAGLEGLTLLNFRQSEPSILLKQPGAVWTNEREKMLRRAQAAAS